MGGVIPRVRLTKHAARRVKERFPELSREVADAGGNLYRVVMGEVADAIAGGRIAKNTPAWIGYRRLKNSHRGHIRYLWPPDESRVYLARRHREDELDVWVVLTVMAPDPRLKADAA